MRAYYNEIDEFAASWLRNLIAAGLIPDGDVDERSITEVTANDVRGYDQCHFFAGIGGWPLALSLATWPDEPVWTGSCPCQPFSAAGKRQAEADERHLWPEFRRLIAECRPATVFGEQVASKLGRSWLSGVRADLEGLGYGVGAADLCAASVGAPHIRQRLFWVAESHSARRTEAVRRSRLQERNKPESGCAALDQWLGSPSLAGLPLSEPGKLSGPQQLQEGRAVSESGGASGIKRLGHANGCGSGQTNSEQQGWHQVATAWSESTSWPCADGASRRVGAGVQPLAHGIPARRSDPRLGLLLAGLAALGHGAKAARGILRLAKRNRVGRLRGYGNAIVPEVAAVFVRSYLDTVSK